MSERFFRTLNYSSVNEDWRTEVAGLRLHDGARVLCVTGSGDRPLNLLAAASAKIVAIDLNRTQNNLLWLKATALRRLPFGKYAAFLGLTPAEPAWREGTLDQLAPHLPPDVRAFWNAHRRMLSPGVLYQGRFERHFRRVSRVARLLRPRDIDTLFAFADLEAQRRFVEERWDRQYWRLASRLALSPICSRLFLRDPAYFAHVAVPVGKTLFERMRRALLQTLARDNFMMSLVLRGELSLSDLPPYLTAGGCERIRERLDLLEVVEADLIALLETPAARKFTHFSLSDVPSYVSESDFYRLVTGAVRCAAPGARVVIRQFLTRYGLPDALARNFVREPELEAELAAEDRSFGYEFIVGTVV